jgi:hypothetical protein
MLVAHLLFPGLKSKGEGMHGRRDRRRQEQQQKHGSSSTHAGLTMAAMQPSGGGGGHHKKDLANDFVGNAFVAAACPRDATIGGERCPRHLKNR